MTGKRQRPTTCRIMTGVKDRANCETRGMIKRSMYVLKEVQKKILIWCDWTRIQTRQKMHVLLCSMFNNMSPVQGGGAPVLTCSRLRASGLL